MNSYNILRRVKLTCQHKPTGKTHHYRGGEESPTPSVLQIVKYPDDSNFYLLYLDADGRELTDTCHESEEKAMSQAEWEFHVQPKEWELCSES